jgi:dipeptidyl aminopeptidase/acylaminoacyl peptidase
MPGATMRKTTFSAALVVLTGLLQVLLVAPSHATVLGGEGQIAFVRANQIYTMTKTGGTVKQLTTVGKNYRPKWSPDGQRIAYINEDTAGRTNVFVMSSTGSGKTKVTTSGTVDTAPVWSPNGSTLAFAQAPASGNYVSIVKATAPFGTPIQLQVLYYGEVTRRPISAYDKTSLAWSPNGQDLAVINGDSEDSPDTGMHLVHGMAGASTAAIAAADHREDVVDFTGGDCCGYQTWTDVNYIPNGTLGWAVLDRGDELQYDPPRPSLDYPGFVSQTGDKAGAPSPNGKDMVFVRTVGTTANIWTSTITGGSRRQVLANGYQPDWQPVP